MRLAHPLLAASLIVAHACKCGDDDKPAAAAASDAHGTQSSLDRSLVRAVESLGPHGALVVVVRPEAWPDLHAVLTAHLGGLPPVVSSMLAPLSPAEALPGLVGLAFGGDPSLRLTGWDAKRPIVASLFEVPLDGPPGAISPQLDVVGGHMPDMRHVVLLPANDAAALVSSLASAAAALRAEPFAELEAGVPGCKAFRRDGFAVAFVPDDDHVRVVAFGPGASAVGDLEDEKRRLVADEPAEVPRTPALALLADGSGVASVLVRPWRLRATAAWLGSFEVVRAIESVARDQASQARAKGQQIMLGAEVTMDDAGADFDDWAAQIVVDHGTPRVRTIASLTPDGRAVLEAAEDGAGRPLARRGGTALVDAYVRFDVRAALDAATEPTATAGAGLGEATERLQEGGAIAFQHAALRHAFGWAKFAERNAKATSIALDVLPIAGQVVWTGIVDDKPTGVVALRFRKGANVAAYAALAELGKADPDLATLSVETIDRGGYPVLLLSMGVQPDALLDLEDDGPDDHLAWVRVEPVAIAAAVRADGEAQQLLAALPPLEMAWGRRGSALAGEWVAKVGKGDDDVGDVGIGRLARWSSPIGVQNSPGVPCLARAASRYASALGAAATVDPASLATVAITELASAAPDLACATADEATAASAAALRRMAVTSLASVLTATRQRTAAIALLSTHCTETRDEATCKDVETLKSLPSPTLTDIEVPYRCGERWDAPVPDATFELAGTSTALDGLPVRAADLEARLAEVKSRMVARAEEYAVDEYAKPVPTLGLAIDRDATMRDVRPALEAAERAGFVRVVVSVKDPASGERTVTANLTATAAGYSALALNLEPGKIALRSPASGVSIDLTAPSVSAIESYLWGLPNFVHAADDTPWREVVLALVATCTDTSLSTTAP